MILTDSFSIVGIDVKTDYADNHHWRQPIILQPEVGYLGILTKEIDGVLYCLMPSCKLSLEM